jgi:hypothetical protein
LIKQAVEAGELYAQVAANKLREGFDFNTYGTVGYTLEQKRDVLMRVLV